MRTPVLIVDDEDTLRGVIAQVLEEDGYDVTEASSGEKALELFRANTFPIVITDIVMGRMSGLELLQEIMLLESDALVVVMTSQGSLDKATAAIRTGAYDFLTKPFESLDVISAVVNRANDKVQLLQQNRSLMLSLKKHAEELEELASHDGLTALHNHRHFREALDQEVGRANRHDRTFSLVFMDVDHFKKLNDSHGHLAGDEVLKGLGEIFRSRKRAAGILARYGGEEFVALLPETAKPNALQYAESIRKRVEEHTFLDCDGQPLGRVTISMGVATFPNDGKDSKALIESADQALYEAKSRGRNAVCGSSAAAREEAGQA